MYNPSYNQLRCMTSLISPRKVLPSGPEDAEILIIGEAPGFEEDESRLPFQGEAGQLLNQGLSIAGFDRNAIRVTNICNYRPNNNKFDLLLDTWQLKEGIDEVTDYIARSRRLRWVVISGGKPLEYILKRRGIEKWRSSTVELSGINYYCSYHPAAVIRDRTLFGTFTFDLRKLYRYVTKGYVKPKNDFVIDPKGIDLEECLREIESYEGIVSCDIEGVKGSTRLLCVGFGLSDSRSIVLGNSDFAGNEFVFWTAIKRILENPNIKKSFQNGFGYDIEVLRENGINVEGYVFDTMVAAHVLEPELPYNLAYLTTIYTDRSYYKDKGRSAIPDDDDKGWGDKVDKKVIYEYNAEDDVTQKEITDKQIKELTEYKLWDTFNYKMSLIPVSQELSRAGMEIDKERKEVLRAAVKMKWKYYQEVINAIAGWGRTVNVKSPIAMKRLLLDEFKLPERRNRNQGITFDEDAIVSYLGFIQDKINSSVRESTIEAWSLKLVACKCILLIRGFRQLLSNYINIKFSQDNRIRSIYNLSAATETGRGSSHKWIDGTGNNAQTWPRERLSITEDEVKILIEKGLMAA